MTPEQMDKIKFCKGMRFATKYGDVYNLNGVDFDKRYLVDQNDEGHIAETIVRIYNPDGTEVEV